MSKRNKHEGKVPSEFDRARDELFSQIIHCGVLGATGAQRDEWFQNTMDYMARRYPGVSTEELAELDALGRRYCEPVRSYGASEEAVTEDATK